MSSRLFDRGRDAFLNALANWTGHTQKAMLLDETVVSSWTKSISAATNASPVVYTTTTVHGFSVGDLVVVGGIGGNASANQTGLIATTPTTTTFTITTLEGAAVAGSGAMSGPNGYVINLTQAQFVSDLSAGREGSDATVPGTSSSKGVANSSNFSWLGVPVGNPVDAVILYDANGGSDATNRLEAFIDGKIRIVVDVTTTVNVAATTVPVEPLKGPIDATTSPTIAFSSGLVCTLQASAAMGARSISVTAAAPTSLPAGSTADTTTTGAGLPVTPNGGNITFTVGTIFAPGTPTGEFQL